MKARHNISILCICLVAILSVFAGCRKAPINGKLDGQWQIMHIENTEDGTNVTSKYRSYIDINLHVVNLHNVTSDEKGGILIGGNLRYDKGASKLTLDFPYNTEGENLTLLQQWGIYTNPVTFDIVKLDGKQLILKSPETIVTCRRF